MDQGLSAAPDLPACPPTEVDATSADSSPSQRGVTASDISTEFFPQRAALPNAASLRPANQDSNPSLIDRELRFQELQELKRILRHGTIEPDGQKILPFVFYSNGTDIVAETAGLEGFLFSEKRFRAQFGEQASAQLVDDYIRYVSNLLRGANSTEAASETICRIGLARLSAAEKHKLFITFLSGYVEELREQVRTLDPAQWSHWSRTYHVFVRAFNLQGRRAAFGAESGKESGMIFDDFAPADIELLRAQSFNCIRLMGTYPIGELGRKGTAGGSPFALRGYDVDPIHGSETMVNEFIKGAAHHGVRTIFEIVLNHTALDSHLLEWNPRLYLHTRSKPEDPTGYFHYESPVHGEFWIRHGAFKDNGTRTYWSDTLQLDLANPDTRRLLCQIACEIVRRYGPHGLRFDASEGMVHDEWKRCWDGDAGRTIDLPQEELLSEIVHAVKAQFPSVICIAEAFKFWDSMSEMGFDLIYGFEDMARERSAKHRGWQASILSRDPERIREAIRRAEFLHWQEGGADMVTFWGHQDKAGPWKLFGEDWKWGAAALTILKPGPFCFYAGTEALYECPEVDEPNDPKVVTFNRPASIDWSGIQSDFGRFQVALLNYYAKLQAEMGMELQFKLLTPSRPGETWVGYAVQGPAGGPNTSKVLVIANPSATPTSVTIDAPELGIRGFNRTLGACGQDGVRLYEFKKP